MKNKSFLQSLVIILTFLLGFYGNRIVTSITTITTISELLYTTYIYLWWLLPAVIVTGLLYGYRHVFQSLGLDKGFFTGLVFALFTVSPMLIGSAVTGHMAGEIKTFPILQKTLFAGFMEEFFFRGFLFGLLFRKAGWGFIPASLLGAVIFGLGHIYQGSGLAETTGIFLITAMGAVWFAWLYVEWNNNLWVPVFLHILMNLSWTLFDVSSNALGGLWPNIFRAGTIALTILITLKSQKGKGLTITRSRLFLNSMA
jgi:membrane protease YdiL (CAAX protease family)